MVSDELKYYTPWLRIEQDGREYRVIMWRHKEKPIMYPGTEIYRDPVSALNAYTLAVMKELQKWE